MCKLLIFVFLSVSAFGQGALVATLANFTNPNYNFGGTVAPYAWITTRSLTTVDFSGHRDQVNPGSTWTYSLEHATLPADKNCTDSLPWLSVPLCSATHPSKGCSVNNVSVNIQGPACIRGRAIVSGGVNPGGGGTASIHSKDLDIHYQSTGGPSTNNGTMFAGNWQTSANHNRSYWINTGNPITSAAGIVTLANAPGAGTWSFKLASSTTPLIPGQNCLGLVYNETPVTCTITGSAKNCLWPPVPVNVPTGGCIQIRGSGPTNIRPGWALDLQSSQRTISYSNAGSGAFDANHVFGVGPWGISDATPQGTLGHLSQMYWIAPKEGLNSCSGAFTFSSSLTGTGQFGFGIRNSTVPLGPGQTCLQLPYSDTQPLCNMTGGNRSCAFGLFPRDIPGNGCFAIVATKTGTISAGTSPFNWQATCIANPPGPPPQLAPRAITLTIGVQQ